MEENKAKNKVNGVIKRISAARLRKGFSYDNMAHELSMSPTAYRKIEIGETKLTVEKLLQISEILSTSLSELLEIGNNVFQQTYNDNATSCYQQKIENFYQENKEVSQALIESLKDKISLLKDEKEFLRGLISK